MHREGRERRAMQRERSSLLRDQSRGLLKELISGLAPLLVVKQEKW